MTNIYLHRYEYQPFRTFGKLFINGEYFCDTLEDTYRDLTIEDKVQSKTCIPSGRYSIIFTYSPKYKKRMPLLLNVHHFEAIRIHPGNTENDTEGCILVGIRTNNTLSTSKVTFEKLMKLIENETNIIINIHNSSTNP